MYRYMYIYMLMRDVEGRKEGRKEEASKAMHTNNKAKQHSTPKAVTFPKKKKVPRVGFKPTTLCALDRTLMYTHYIYILHFPKVAHLSSYQSV